MIINYNNVLENLNKKYVYDLITKKEEKIREKLSEWCFNGMFKEEYK